MPRAIDWLGIFPGLFALALALTNFWRRQALAPWQRGLIAFCGILALVCSIAFQVVLAQERHVSDERSIARDKEVAAVNGKMDALLALVPSLAKGDPNAVVSAQRDVAELQRRLESLETARGQRRLTNPQRAALTTALAPFGKNYSVDIDILGDGDPEGRRYANDFAAVFSSLGWIVTVNPGHPMLPVYPGVFIYAVQKDDPAARTLDATLRELGVPSKLSEMDDGLVAHHRDKGTTSEHFHVNVAPRGAAWPETHAKE